MKHPQLSYGLNLLTHWRKLADAVSLVGAKAQLDFETFRVEVIKDDRCLEFVPTFVSPGKTLLDYDFSNEPTPRAIAFSGWGLSAGNALPMQGDKLEFKRFCVANGLATPRLFESQAAEDGRVAVLRKEARNEFFRGQCRGPLPLELAQKQWDQVDGWFYEEFVQGETLQAWYWNDKLYCVEQRAWPSVIGDGASTIRQLMEIGFPGNKYVDLIDPVLRWQNYTRETILPLGARVFLTFRFHSVLHRAMRTNENILDKIRGNEVHQQLEKAGRVFAGAVSSTSNANTPYSVSCIIDSNNRVWFVSLQHPSELHPDIYSTMFESIFNVVRSTEVRQMVVGQAK